VIRLVLAGLLVAGILAPSVAAHGDGGARGYRSVVTGVRPPVPGLEVRVLDSDDRLVVANRTGRTIEFLGYDGEPYLRFTPDAVLRNQRSPATYLNEDRYAQVTVPETASADAEPVWEQIADEPIWEWHDHRIHWMSTIDPPRIRAEPDVAQHVFDWSVPGELDGERFAIRGTLDYEPPPSSRFSWIWAAPLALLAAAGAVLVAWRVRRGGGGSAGGG
jgi:hypothetical protein